MSIRKSAQQKIQEDIVGDISEDRRKKRRYPINLQVEFKIVKNYLVIGSGSGSSIDLSSNGIAFTTDKQLRVGSYLELSASWPVLLDGSCPLKLVIFGKVIRSDGNIVAVAADRHEFRTRRVGAAQPTAIPMTMAAGFR